MDTAADSQGIKGELNPQDYSCYEDPTDILIDVAAQGNVEVVKYMIEDLGMSADSIDDGLKTPLMSAALIGQPDVAKYLLEDAHANVHLRDGYDCSALHYALIHRYDDTGWGEIVLDRGLVLYNGPGDILELLLCNGADANERDNNAWTPLMIATSYLSDGCSPETLSPLIEHGAELDAQNCDGSTALMIAAENGNNEAVKYLLSKGADPGLKNNDGLTAYQIAERKGHNEATDILQL